MNNKRLAGITIGQSPRVDITYDIAALLSRNIELVEYGALDPYTLEEATERYSPVEGDDVLVSRMRDGAQVRLAEKYVSTLVQDCIQKAEKDGVDGILILCTGMFPIFIHHVPLIVPQPILHATVAKIAQGEKVGVIVPDSAQLNQVKAWWNQSGAAVEIVAGSPYLGISNVENAARSLKTDGVSLICLDCFGYSLAMKKLVAEITGKPVLLPRTFMASVANELFGVVEKAF